MWQYVSDHLSKISCTQVTDKNNPVPSDQTSTSGTCMASQARFIEGPFIQIGRFKNLHGSSDHEAGKSALHACQLQCFQCCLIPLLTLEDKTSLQKKNSPQQQQIVSYMWQYVSNQGSKILGCTQVTGIANPVPSDMIARLSPRAVPVRCLREN